MIRLLQFRKELAILWRAFMSPGTPAWLKGLMLLVPAYLLFPFDILPDVIPLVGWLDDLVIIPLMVSFIVGLLPQQTESRARAWRPEESAPSPSSQTIDGEWRRL